METQTNESAPNFVKAYSPKRYDLIGLFFSLIPVFIMSFANSKVFSSGETIRKRMKISLAIFIVLISLASVSEIVLFSSPLGKNIVMLETTALSRIPFFGTTDTISITRRIYAEDYAMFEKIQNYIVGTFLILHFVLIVWVVRFTNKYEWPAYQALRDAQRVKPRYPFMPLGVAVIILGALYFGQPVVYATVLRQVYRLKPVSTTLKRNPSATPSPVVSTKTIHTVLDVLYLREKLREFRKDKGYYPSSDDDYLAILGFGLASSGWTIEPPPPRAKFYLTEDQIREMHKYSFFWYRGNTSGNFYWVEFDLETEYHGQLDGLKQGVNCATPEGIFSRPCREIVEPPVAVQGAATPPPSDRGIVTITEVNKADVEIMRAALERYYRSEGRYPLVIEGEEAIGKDTILTSVGWFSFFSNDPAKNRGTMYLSWDETKDITTLMAYRGGGNDYRIEIILDPNKGVLNCATPRGIFPTSCGEVK